MLEFGKPDLEVKLVVLVVLHTIETWVKSAVPFRNVVSSEIVEA